MKNTKIDKFFNFNNDPSTGFYKNKLQDSRFWIKYKKSEILESKVYKVCALTWLREGLLMDVEEILNNYIKEVIRDDLWTAEIEGDLKDRILPQIAEHFNVPLQDHCFIYDFAAEHNIIVEEDDEND